MEPVLQKGKLTTWKSDRGFGFIQPDDGSKEVFLHITALKDSGRRPKVGDIIWYEQIIGENGKLRASKASIQSVAPRRLQSKQKLRKQVLLTTGMSIVIPIAILSIVVFCTIEFNRTRPPAPTTSFPEPGCAIKGNISIDTGDKLYHLPSMRDYDITVINPEYGERWFCTEAEAIANGWSKAPR